VAALLLASGCVRQGPPGVGVQKLAADIVFGARAAIPLPPNLAPGPVGPGDATTYLPASGPAGGGVAPGATDAGDFDAGPGRPGRLRPVTPLNPPRTPCPPAALTAFPAKEAGLMVEGLPATGQYRWKRTGTQTPANLPGVKLPVAGFEQRLVRNVVRVSATEYTFETVQPELGSDVTTISTFKVRTDAVSTTAAPPVQPPDPNHPSRPVPQPVQVPGTQPPLPKAPVPDTLSVGEPERGVSLIRLQRVDSAGNTSEVDFSPGVLYLPLPIVPGEEWTAVGADPRTGSMLQHQAKVVKRERVDACGDVVDGWAIEATQTFSIGGQTAPPRTYRYIVAPQLGGLIISEAIHTATSQGTTDVTLSLGQLQPSPLPARPAQPGAKQ
jgi:hypothetical protein